MYRIEITEEVESTYDMVDLLNTIATKVKEGYTSGYYPHWQLIRVESTAPSAVNHAEHHNGPQVSGDEGGE